MLAYISAAFLAYRSKLAALSFSIAVKGFTTGSTIKGNSSSFLSLDSVSIVVSEGLAFS